ncbi:hypothetical protein SAMN02745136_00846 [Anaerocolumna jejuensis DSM 15929]|uniref:Uncharacterized protein n=1 Tax=Anaerocolumna jejuensis DSM 15929 TaxID=1121322 RepID=A0A1M6M4X1_9FIRM|nr:hypothetical protein [Anaerocolumna jejuensis]SHJ78524.1 hypothetical protein SAMN02745136_00846 [Anaerocolumna jejuensis DSM 15929]
MKKIAVVFINFLLFLFVWSVNYRDMDSLPSDSDKVSLNQLPENYSLEDAKSDNCVAFEDSDITYGQSAWNTFVSKAKKGKPAAVRLGYYYTLGDPSRYSKEYYESIKDDYPILYIRDLKYDGYKYTVEDLEDGSVLSKDYKYMMKYEGKPRSATALFSKYSRYVLINDTTVSWDEIENSMLSSQSGAYIDHTEVYTDLEWK